MLALDMNSTASCTCLLVVRCRHEVDGGDWISNVSSSKKTHANRAIDIMTSHQEEKFQGKEGGCVGMSLINPDDRVAVSRTENSATPPSHAYKHPQTRGLVQDYGKIRLPTTRSLDRHVTVSFFALRRGRRLCGGRVILRDAAVFVHCSRGD